MLRHGGKGPGPSPRAARDGAEQHREPRRARSGGCRAAARAPGEAQGVRRAPPVASSGGGRRRAGVHGRSTGGSSLVPHACSRARTRTPSRVNFARSAPAPARRSTRPRAGGSVRSAAPACALACAAAPRGPRRRSSAGQHGACCRLCVLHARRVSRRAWRGANVWTRVALHGWWLPSLRGASRLASAADLVRWWTPRLCRRSRLRAELRTRASASLARQGRQSRSCASAKRHKWACAVKRRRTAGRSRTSARWRTWCGAAGSSRRRRRWRC